MSTPDSKMRASAFRDFLEDALFLEHLREAHNLGYPFRAKRALRGLKKKVIAMLQESRFRGMLDLVFGSVNIATQPPVPHAEECVGAIREGYLPPSINTARVWGRPMARWLQS